MKQVTILGATGSIGQSTLDIIARHPDRFELHALTANTSQQKMLQLCHRFKPKFVVMRDSDSALQLEHSLNDSSITVLNEEAGLVQVAAADEVDIVVAAIVGAVELEVGLEHFDTSILGTDVTAADGQSLVLGTTSPLTGGGALILVVTPTIEGG